MPLNDIQLKKSGADYVGTFTAMASPCEVLIDTDNEATALAITECAAAEAWRIEQAFSRYRDDNIIYRINNSHGKPIDVDKELARLLDFSQQCYEISNGLFDITSGVLRKIWKFDGSDNIPSRKQAKALLAHIGWSKVEWQPPRLRIEEGMEIDLGGIGKEYAVDRAALLIKQQWHLPVLINFGGDLFATQKPNNRPSWQVGIESIGGGTANATIQLQNGALTTSGDARRYLERNGQRYSHVLNPRTGWPVKNAPRSVTVAAHSCVDAGFISTLAMLQGKGAREFLDAQGIQFWVQD